MSERRWSKSALALLALGLSQMAADLAGLRTIGGIASATLLSPKPRVFSAVRGLETYSTRFFLEWEDAQGETHSLELTPDVYSRLRGPYNRRNVYGAVLAYGPVLATDEHGREMLRAVTGHALGGAAPLLRELGVDPREVASGLRMRYEPRPGSELGDLPTTIALPLP